jgi:hypothetical protein
MTFYSFLILTDMPIPFCKLNTGEMRGEELLTCEVVMKWCILAVEARNETYMFLSSPRDVEAIEGHDPRQSRSRRRAVAPGSLKASADQI